MTTTTTTLADRSLAWSGRQPCCGATNRLCSTPFSAIATSLTGCDNCGHPLGCHAWSERA